MKNIVITLAALALCLSARAANHTLSTEDGETYTGITLARLEPDGVYIEYSIPGGGFGMSKVKFSRLSPAQQKEFGYDKGQAQNYEAAVAQANDNAAEELIQRAQAERDARHQREIENERAYPGRMTEITRLNTAMANAFYDSMRSTESKPNTASFQNSYGGEFAPGHILTQTTFSPGTPDVFAGHDGSTSLKAH
jgi:hypothetical protein